MRDIIEMTARSLLLGLRMDQSRWDETIIEFNTMSTNDRLELLFRMCIQLGGDVAILQEYMEDE